MSKANRQDYAGTILRVADELEHRRIPLILQTRRHFAPNGIDSPRELATIGRQIGDALREAFRHDLEHGPGATGTGRSRARNGDKILDQLRTVVRASTANADPNAYAQLVGDALRKMVEPKR